ncbi:sulfite dehydrogenase [Novacetimonas hansenii]|uniref:Putative Oxidoreductase, molybdopterin binding protein n=1 Tax=Novacetimonas hansenii ATCC 23769 TaxID=714995 RepID=D5QEA5_NOVHA|nr:sulfite dehydrogenase [Novacetimonas hansenii]EFG84586.1 putative Oxidoreductase, molybdopterin binding protein [Novacetimonas hansenii ATCC 23769]
MTLNRRKLLTRTVLFSTLFQKNKTSEAADLDIPSWTREPGAPILKNPYGKPSSFEKDVVRRTFTKMRGGQGSTLTPLASLHGIITPGGLHFERHHAGVPEIDPAQHALVVHGLVDQPMRFSLDDLHRLPSVSRLCFIECSGNTGTEWTKATRTDVQSTHGLLSCSEWTGVPLPYILAETGIKADARWILAEGADGAAMSRSIPLAKGLDDVIVAYAQNGEALRPEQGYPLRLICPGYEGNMNIKWLRRLKLGQYPFYTREETSKYTDLLPDGKARQFSFTMGVKSVIVRPSGGMKLSSPGLQEINGLAWSGHGKITKVHVSIDGGKQWTPARLDGLVLDKCLTRFTLPWVWNGQKTILQSKAYDEAGNVQETRQVLRARYGDNLYYHNNGIQSWLVSESGDISNVFI